MHGEMCISPNAQKIDRRCRLHLAGAARSPAKRDERVHHDDLCISDIRTLAARLVLHSTIFAKMITVFDALQAYCFRINIKL